MIYDNTVYEDETLHPNETLLNYKLRKEWVQNNYKTSKQAILSDSDLNLPSLS